MINIEDVPGLETELQMVNTHIERLCRSNNKSMGTRGAGIAPTPVISMTASGGRKKAGRHTLAPTRRPDDR